LYSAPRPWQPNSWLYHRNAGAQGRIARLDRLARGLAEEVSLWMGGNDPLLLAERRMYLKAIQDALAGAEEAKVVLARVVNRLGGA
jgi:hypothetical protein